ncbi:hypothetical protein Unana1_01120 [Umbelopsis nana]
MDSTAASANFYREFQFEKDAIQSELSRCDQVEKPHLDQHFEDLLVSINTLERKLTDSMDFIPGYDQRQFSLSLRTLKDNLAVARGNLTPRTKFSFKSRSKKTTNATANTKHPKPIEANIASSPITPNLIDSSTIKFAQVQDSFLTFSETSNKVVDISISNAKRCIIQLPEKGVSAVNIKDIEECVIIADRFRMHDSNNVKLLLSVSSHPIMEDSKEITIGAYRLDPGPSNDSHDNSSEYVESGRNYYDRMEDFNWLKQQDSPNWRLMDTAMSDTLNEAVAQLDVSKAKRYAENPEIDLYAELFTT